MEIFSLQPFEYFARDLPPKKLRRQFRVQISALVLSGFLAYLCAFVTLPIGWWRLPLLVLSVLMSVENWRKTWFLRSRLRRQLEEG